MTHGSPPSPAHEPSHRYNTDLAAAIEPRWQREWAARKTFRQPNPGEPGFDASRPKFYCLDMFPYPSGAGLHVGHPEGYTATDIICRYKRHNGFNVLHPMGWDAFGLPAEQYAIQTGIHPAETTRKSIENFRRQLQRFGFCYDWDREFGTIDQDYYKWTQWIFLRLYDSWFDTHAPSPTGCSRGRARPISELIRELESGTLLAGPSGEIVRPAMGNFAAPLEGASGLGRAWHQLSNDERRLFIDNQRLAYLGEQTVNWCPKLGTVLANDEVIDGKSERGGFPVLRKPLKQWMFRITAYADRLLEQLARLEWPASTRTQQEEWIGRSTGAQVDFAIDERSLSPQALGELKRSDADTPLALTIYTTRPDTIFGATFMVVAPEHPLIDHVVRHPSPGSDAEALRAYVARARNTSDTDRMAGREKTGVFSGVYAINPLTDERIPVWVADYVLMGYGTGAIMAVPAHDERDFEFARTFSLPIVDVLYPRTPLAMKFFCEQATPEESSEGVWQPMLADFLGLVTSTPGVDGGSNQRIFEESLETVRGRRFTDPATPDRCPVDAPSLNSIGMSGRGAIRVSWFEAFEAMGLTSLQTLREVFRARGFQAWRGEAGVSPGVAAHSSRPARGGMPALSIDGLNTADAVARVVAWLEETGLGASQTRFKLRDWTFSRQRYWGEPFPIVFDEQGRHFPVSEGALPVVLPTLTNYAPEESEDPQPLLGKAKQWVHTTAFAAGVDPRVLPASTPVRRETNTMPGSAGSSWYAIRYADPKNSERFVGEEAERYWLGGASPDAPGGRLGAVDLYIGGSEHAVGHLLYSRFWHNVLFDLGFLGAPEPFQKLFHQGLITAYSFQRADKSLCPNDQVETRPRADARDAEDVEYFETATGQKVTPVVAKMSKSLKNVVNPDDIIEQFGADTFRLYEMYMGPLEASKPWNTRDISGLHRFLQRVWRVLVDEQTGAPRLRDEPLPAIEKSLHRTVHKVSQDIERLAFNTAIAAIIQLVNDAMSAAGEKGTGAFTPSQADAFCVMLCPFAPHICEEVWHRRHAGARWLCSDQSWPAVDASLLVDDAVEIPVQIQGKVRARISVPTGSDAGVIEAKALSDEGVQKAIAGRPVRKIIVVPGKLVNIVV